MKGKANKAHSIFVFCC